MTDYNAIAEKYHASLADYKNEDMFSLGYQWTDKPHRHVFDLCKHLQAADEAITAQQAELDKVRPRPLSEITDSEALFIKNGEAYMMQRAENSKWFIGKTAVSGKTILAIPLSALSTLWAPTSPETPKAR